MDRVQSSRHEVEKRLADLRQAVGSEVGFVPRVVGWLLPLAAFSVGLTLAGRAYRRRRRSRPAGQEAVRLRTGGGA